MVQLGAEFTAVVFPDFAIGIVEPFFLLREPVWLVGAGFGDEIDVEAGLAEDGEWVEGFGDEEAGFLAVGVERRVG